MRVLPLVLLCAACGNADPNTGRAAVRDSAGVEIVEVGGAFMPWEVTDTIARIGVVSGEAPYQFESIEFAARLTYGGTVVVDRGMREVRWFDADGSHVRSFGRRGQGPGEFATISEVRLAGDTLVIHDALNQRITRIGFADSTPHERRLPGGRRNQLIGAGRKLIVAARNESAADYTRDFSRTPGVIAVVAIAERIDTLAVVPGADVGFWSSFGPGRTLSFDLPFSAGPLFALMDDHVAIIDGSHPEIRLIDQEGRTARIIRIMTMQAQPVTDAERDRFIAHAESTAVLAGRPSRPSVEFAHNALSVLRPDALVALFDRMLAGSDGSIWLRRYRKPWAAAEPQHWLVLEPDGSPAGELRLDSGFELLHAGTGVITGVVTDDLDVHYALTLRVDERPR